MLTQSDPRLPMERAVPTFVGRDEHLALALRRWNAAVDGAGHFLLISGEAGIGKTRLVAEVVSHVHPVRQVRAGAFPRDVEAVGGLITDLSDAVRKSGEPTAADALRDRLIAEPVSGDNSRNRRMLVADLADTIRELLASASTLLIIEDLHWADELSLDVLERVAAAVGETTSMIVATYRSDELYPKSPLRRLRSRLIEQRFAEEVRLPRLSVDQTGSLIRSISAAEPGVDSIRGIYDRSDGIPLYVEELFANAGTSVPDSIAEAIVGKVEELRRSSLPVLEAAAVIGRSFQLDLLVSVDSGSEAEIDAALHELGDRNLVLAGVDGRTFDFRHAVIRDVIYEHISPLRRRDLHGLVAAAARDSGFADSFLSDQFERAGNPAIAYQYALRAAREAVAMSSNRAAVELFRRVQRTTPTTVSPRERAGLYAELATVLAATDDNESAAAQLTTAIDLYRADGDEISAARLIPALSAALHLLGTSYEPRAQLLGETLRRLDELDTPVPLDLRAALLSALAAAYMLDRCLDDAIEAGTQAAALADEAGATSERIDIDLTLGSVLVFAGPGDEGWPLLETAIRQAKGLPFEALAARGYRMIGSSASALVEYVRARRWIAEGLEYTRVAERWNDYHYLQAHDAHVRWATGAWDEAGTIAERSLADGRGGVTTRNMALVVLGYLAMGRGDFAGARRLLDEAREIGEAMRELQRFVPPLWGLSELELLDGNAASAIELTELAYSRSEPIGDAAYIFPFVISGTRAYLAARDTTAARNWLERATYLLTYRGIPGTLPAIAHAEGLLLLAEGHSGEARARLETARAGWTDRERIWEATRATIDLATCAARSRRPRDAARLAAEARELAERIGSSTLADLANSVASPGAPSGPLSERELEVARLIATGATNREIASQLTISPKTASAHVEHILDKLGVARRSEVAAWISRDDH